METPGRTNRILISSGQSFGLRAQRIFRLSITMPRKLKVYGSGRLSLQLQLALNSHFCPFCISEDCTKSVRAPAKAQKLTRLFGAPID